MPDSMTINLQLPEDEEQAATCRAAIDDFASRVAALAPRLAPAS
ncbi:hypothetical protein [Knoellia sp. LjRoot47]